jgi:urease accessory protein
MNSWMILQLADSAFPTGGFVHSGGLEALVQAGEVRGRGDVERFCADTAKQTARGALPIVGAAFDDPDRLAAIDAFTRTTLWSHVASRASQAQGWALLDTVARAFDLPAAREARAQLAGGGHLAPVFGFVTRLLEVSRDDALATFLHLTIRGVLSAAIRLGATGPSEAQAMHRRLHPVLDAALAEARELGLDDVAQTAPLIELFQGTHDRLYSRLFQS